MHRDVGWVPLGGWVAGHTPEILAYAPCLAGRVATHKPPRHSHVHPRGTLTCLHVTGVAHVLDVHKGGALAEQLKLCEASALLPACG